ncbi:uncharacterized protein LOC125234283 isoform X1 [Leguminivora glycinivorella]|uniref:uncharacterized protein LOC125227887 isoform X1 n=2 Tax=Leguminivora glycinivorella TaxID=1035111 RepID=UPI00200FFD27|nr:uncharacterized protein LOC125227887 isoform X1 [Leguminivora glycinivorella]XP_047996463.1 uncharacterized protein LOC125234283 isoform X1 [Leguminivora glycinivorella]
MKIIQNIFFLSNIKPEEFNLLAAKIVSLFPTESIYIYYMKAVPTCKSASRKYVPAKGKLVDKVRNLLYISGAKRRSIKSTCSNKDSDTDVESVENNQETASNDDAIWLKHNNEPWDQVCERWNNTFELRHKQKFETVHDFLETWAILKDGKADTLILLDFEKQFKEKSLNFFKNWELFFSKLLKLRESVVTNDNAKALIEGLGNIIDDDKKIPVQIYLLGFLIPPKGRKSRKVKFSTTESIQGLLVQIDDAGDIDSVIAAQKAKAAARKDTVQPFVLIQGPLQNFAQIYIVIDDIKYHVHSAAKAFDLLFKIYHVFHAKYPQVCEHLHIIIQKKCIKSIQRMIQYHRI